MEIDNRRALYSLRLILLAASIAAITACTSKNNVERNMETPPLNASKTSQPAYTAIDKSELKKPINPFEVHFEKMAKKIDNEKYKLVFLQPIIAENLTDLRLSINFELVDYLVRNHLIDYVVMTNTDNNSPVREKMLNVVRMHSSKIEVIGLNASNGWNKVNELKDIAQKRQGKRGLIICGSDTISLAHNLPGRDVNSLVFKLSISVTGLERDKYFENGDPTNLAGLQFTEEYSEFKDENNSELKEGYFDGILAIPYRHNNR